MARREIGEINAGSMADIAFLLLIFFLVTTTMEVDAGIGRNLPMKSDEEIPIEDRPKVLERDVLQVMANSNDQLMVEGKFIEVDEFEEIVKAFFLDNRRSDVNPDMPKYETITIEKCRTEISVLNGLLENDPPNKAQIEKDVEKWKTKMEICRDNGGQFREISSLAVIRLQNQAKTSYGLYIQLQNILSKVMNELRQEQCDLYGWPSYKDLDEENPEDNQKLEKLKILVPERIIEAPIEL